MKTRRAPRRRCLSWRGLATLVLLLAPAVLAPARAGDPHSTQVGGILSPSRTFSEQTGESLYANVCGGCHMADGRGAVGAGRYPSLVGNDRLEAAAYPLHVVVDGLRGMPAVGRRMSDDQVAAVVTYVRTHFDNHYPDGVTAEDVKRARP